MVFHNYKEVLAMGLSNLCGAIWEIGLKNRDPLVVPLLIMIIASVCHDLAKLKFKNYHPPDEAV